MSKACRDRASVAGRVRQGGVTPQRHPDRHQLAATSSPLTSSTAGLTASQSGGTVAKSGSRVGEPSEANVRGMTCRTEWMGKVGAPAAITVLLIALLGVVAPRQASANYTCENDYPGSSANHDCKYHWHTHHICIGTSEIH